MHLYAHFTLVHAFLYIWTLQLYDSMILGWKTAFQIQRSVNCERGLRFNLRMISESASFVNSPLNMNWIKCLHNPHTPPIGFSDMVMNKSHPQNIQNVQLCGLGWSVFLWFCNGAFIPPGCALSISHCPRVPSIPKQEVNNKVEQEPSHLVACFLSFQGNTAKRNHSPVVSFGKRCLQFLKIPCCE